MASSQKDDGQGRVKFSEAVESAIKEICTTDSDLTFDSQFNPVDYINQSFPNEQSLSGIDEFVKKIRLNIRQVDEEILLAVRKQSSTGPKAKEDLVEAKKAIQELFTKVGEIKRKAEQSEHMVQEICRDIKSLDNAKRHLTTTITALKRLHMLATAVDQLKTMSKNKQYKDAANYLEAVTQLASHFNSYKDIEKVRVLRDRITVLRTTLQRQIFEDFKGLEAQEQEGSLNAAQLADACLVVDALGEDTRRELVSGYCTQKINVYKMMFTAGRENSNLENTDKRFTWLKKQLKAYEENFAKIFPSYWNVPQELAVEFCLATREDMSRMLREAGESDVNTLLKSLRRTLDFERDLTNRFASRNPVPTSEGVGRDDMVEDEEEGGEETLEGLDLTTAEGVRKKYEIMRRKEKQRANQEKQRGADLFEDEEREKKSDSSYRYQGLISSCFEPYLDIYVQFEERNMTDVLARVLREESWVPNDDKIFESCVNVFWYIHKSLKDTAEVSRGPTLLELFKIWKKQFKAYSDTLSAKLPKPVSGGSVSATKDMLMKLPRVDLPNLPNLTSLRGDGAAADAEDSVQITLAEREEAMVCTVVNTAEYCVETLGKLADEVKKKIQEEYLAAIDVQDIQDEFSGVVTKGIKTLVSGVETRLEAHLQVMVRVQWGTYESVGDQSEYVSLISASLAESVPNIARSMSPSYLSFFCDKFAASFIPKFIASIYKCKRISGPGAQQLLLDTQSLKSMLLNISNLDPKSFANISLTRMSKLVQKEMTKAETILKIILTPPETLVDSYRSLVPEGSVLDLQKILDLKGIKKNEQQPFVDAYSQSQPSQQQASNSGSSQPSAMASKILPTSVGPIKIKPENLKKLFDF